MKILIFTIILFLSISELLFSQYIIYNFPDVAEFKVFEKEHDEYGYDVAYVTIRNFINNEEYLLATHMNYNTQFINLFEKDLDQDNEMEYILMGACTAEIQISQCYIFDFKFATKPVCEFSLMGSNSSSNFLKYSEGIYYFIIPCEIGGSCFAYQSFIYGNGKLIPYNKNTDWEFNSLVNDNINSKIEYLNENKDNLSLRNDEFSYGYLSSLEATLLQLLILDDTTNIEDIAKSYIDIKRENWLINNVKEKYQEIVGETYEYKENLLYHKYISPYKYKIKYKIPKTTFVKLFIADSLENEISLLVNEEQVFGEYEVIWDATDFPYDMYYCTLKTPEFVETRRLVHMKRIKIEKSINKFKREKIIRPPKENE